jgi:hypothetical protein
MLRVLSDYGVASLRSAQRNKRKLLLISMASVGAAAAIVYARRQYAAIREAMDAERSIGALSLRSVYVASRRTVDSTLRALLRPGRERVFACAAANPDALVAKLKTDLTGAEKKQVWERLKIAAIVRLVVSIFYVVIVYAILLVQVNLVARYSTSDSDAPIEELDGGELSLESKQRFLSLARRRLFEEGGIEALTALVAEATEEVIGPVKLTAKVGPDDMRDMLRNVCRLVEIRGKLDGTGTSQRDNGPDYNERPQVFSAHWLLSGGGESGEDENVCQLVNESLDLCEALDYESLVQSSVDTLMDVAGGLVDGYVWGMSSEENNGKVAFAPVVAKVANVSRQILMGERYDSTVGPSNLSVLDEFNVTEGQTDGPFVGALLHLSTCEMFGAGVFLSGERDDSGNSEGDVPRLHHGLTEVDIGDRSSRRSSVRHGSALGEIQNILELHESN